MRQATKKKSKVKIKKQVFWKRHKSLLSFLSILIGISSLVLFGLIMDSLNSKPPAIAHEEEIEDTGILLSKENYDKYLKIFINNLNSKDPSFAMNLLAQYSQTNPRIYRECHTFAHSIGQESFAKYNNFSEAMKYQDDYCGNGYMHGVMEGYLGSLPAGADISPQLKQVCYEAGLPQFMGNCFHAIGHGIMYYTINDLPKSLKMCNTLGTSTAVRRCNEGAYMENFIIDRKTHTSYYLKSDDLFYPCDDPKFPNREICYFYSPLNYLNAHPEDYIGALNWCNTSREYKNACAEGAGSRTMKQNLDSPKRAESDCVSGPANLVNSCIAGMASYYVVNFSSVNHAREMCSTLDSSHQSSCYSAANARRGLFAN